MDDREIIHLIFDVFGVVIDYGTDRKSLLKTLKKLSS